jgi:hypothetical protein
MNPLKNNTSMYLIVLDGLDSQQVKKVPGLKIRGTAGSLPKP